MDAKALTTRFWRAALLAPAVGAVIGYFAADYGLLFLTVGFVAVATPYAAFAVLMWWLVGHLRSTARVITLALLAPIVFLPFVLVGLALMATLGKATWSGWFDAAGLWLPWILGLGYAYVLLLLLLFALVRHFISSRGPFDGPSPAR
jgi:hypothetical protein